MLSGPLLYGRAQMSEISGHNVPLNAGLGASQERALSRVPPSPEVLLQGVQVVHKSHIQSTRKKQTNKKKMEKMRQNYERFSFIIHFLPYTIT